MRTFLLQSCSTLVFVMAAANLLFAVLLLRQFARKRLPVLLCMGLIAVGLCYDALVISLGSVLRGLCWPRSASCAL